jgi:uncharacterized membrane protein YeaQ/YmgE (transglycosylase-associated protein family)
MSLLVALVIGGIIGWIGAAIAGRREGILGSVAIGIVGSIIGGVLSSLFNGSNQGYLTFSWGGFIWSLIGAVILSALLNMVQHRTRHNI